MEAKRNEGHDMKVDLCCNCTRLTLLGLMWVRTIFQSINTTLVQIWTFCTHPDFYTNLILVAFFYIRGTYDSQHDGPSLDCLDYVPKPNIHELCLILPGTSCWEDILTVVWFLKISNALAH